MRGRPGLPPRVPLPSSDGAADHFQQLARSVAAQAREQASLARAITHLVGTEDLIVYEHETVNLNPAVSTETLNLQPQTAQQELITGLFCAITVPDLVAGPTITISNAWAKLGDLYLNLNAIINSAAGTGGVLPGELGIILNSQSTRQINLVATAEWPAGTYLTFALFGKVISSSIPGILH